MRSPTENDILVVLLLHGERQPQTISEKADRHPRSISRSISNLTEEGLVMELGRSNYGLTIEGYSEARELMSRRVERAAAATDE